MNIDNLINNGLEYLVILILIVFLYEWITLLINKREAKKSNIVCNLIIAFSRLIIILSSVIDVVFEVNREFLLSDFIVETIAMTLFLVFGITEWIFYRQNREKNCQRPSVTVSH